MLPDVLAKPDAVKPDRRVNADKVFRVAVDRLDFKGEPQDPGDRLIVDLRRT